MDEGDETKGTIEGDSEDKKVQFGYDGERPDIDDIHDVRHAWDRRMQWRMPDACGYL